MTALTISADDLSDEGLDLLLRIALNTDDRLIDDWRQMGRLLEEHRVDLGFLSEKFGWTADIPGSDVSASGATPLAAIGRAVLLKLKPDGVTFRLPQDKLRELLAADFWAKSINETRLMLATMGIDDGKVTIDLQAD